MHLEDKVASGSYGTYLRRITLKRVRGFNDRAKIRWRIEHDYRELKTGLGHFEGRSFAGWQRHVTLAALAQAFCTMIRTDPKAPAPE